MIEIKSLEVIVQVERAYNVQEVVADMKAMGGQVAEYALVMEKLCDIIKRQEKEFRALNEDLGTAEERVMKLKEEVDTLKTRMKAHDSSGIAKQLLPKGPAGMGLEKCPEGMKNGCDEADKDESKPWNVECYGKYSLGSTETRECNKCSWEETCIRTTNKRNALISVEKNQCTDCMLKNKPCHCDCDNERVTKEDIEAIREDKGCFGCFYHEPWDDDDEYCDGCKYLNLCQLISEEENDGAQNE